MRTGLNDLETSQIDHDTVLSQANRLRAFSLHLESTIDRWRPVLETWHGASATAHHNSIESLKRHAPEIRDRIERAAGLVERLSRVGADAASEISRIARSLEASADIDAQLDPVQLEAERRRAQVRIDEIVANLRLLDQRSAGQIDELATTRVSPPTIPDSRPDDRQQLLSAVSATRERIERHIASLVAAIARLQRKRSKDHPSESLELDRLSGELQLHGSFITPERQILDWDPNGDGRLVEVFGDLGSAEHIAVVVPGITNTIRNFDRLHARRSKDLWTAASKIDPDTAVIAWLGYDAPEVVNAVTKTRAKEYQSALRSFIARLPQDAHVTVVAHSYGTVLAAEAAAHRLPVSDLVMLGSPGTRFEHVDQLILGGDAQVWAGVSDTDRLVGRSSVASVLCPEIAIGTAWAEAARWIINPMSIPISPSVEACVVDSDGDVKGLSHGTNPAHEDFGAIELDTSGVGGHSSYFDRGSPTLDDVARIVTGTHRDQD